ncbi:hypothetical protein JD844_021558, partial [Phrynosoma platyrhinos]
MKFFLSSKPISHLLLSRCYSFCKESMSLQVPVRPICNWRSLLNWLSHHTLVCVKNSAFLAVLVP